jgi:L-amino acid N-acyltransferase YncA
MAKGANHIFDSSLIPLFGCEQLDLVVYPCEQLYQANKEFVIDQTLKVLTPNVVKSLPPHFHDIEATFAADSWLLSRFQECQLLAIVDQDKRQLIGFIFVYMSEQSARERSQHLGYLLAESCWGKGFATQILSSYITYCKQIEFKGVIHAGVESDNIGSIKVLKKCGFMLSNQQEVAEGNLFYQLSL